MCVWNTHVVSGAPATATLRVLLSGLSEQARHQHASLHARALCCTARPRWRGLPRQLLCSSYAARTAPPPLARKWCAFVFCLFALAAFVAGAPAGRWPLQPAVLLAANAAVAVVAPAVRGARQRKEHRSPGAIWMQRRVRAPCGVPRMHPTWAPRVLHIQAENLTRCHVPLDAAALHRSLCALRDIAPPLCTPTITVPHGCERAGCADSSHTVGLCGPTSMRQSQVAMGLCLTQSCGDTATYMRRGCSVCANRARN